MFVMTNLEGRGHTSRPAGVPPLGAGDLGQDGAVVTEEARMGLLRIFPG